LQSCVVCVFKGANVRAHCVFLSCSCALLLHLFVAFNEQINNDDDDDDGGDGGGGGGAGGGIVLYGMVWYGILGFNVPLDTV